MDIESLVLSKPDWSESYASLAERHEVYRSVDVHLQLEGRRARIVLNYGPDDDVTFVVNKAGVEALRRFLAEIDRVKNE